MASFRFCSECNNMLYPKEDHMERKLMFVCRHCEHNEGAEHSCVYKHVVSIASREVAAGGKDLPNDPTFPRQPKECPKCHHEEAVFSQSRSKNRDATMKLFYSCCNPDCGHRWTE